ncbi:M28 family peptidase [Shewanella sp. UCD-KL12]|uniref:M28 family peptidase n=1 Tax=Shewanella sp. UCD-KL12 TaxID=1917163 RepID=UPI000970AB32|nr:M28 family peptidase [Shewanella sp. UCD-KL12]
MALLLLAQLVSACSQLNTSNSPTCRSQLSLNWATTDKLQEDLTILSSRVFQGRKTGTAGAEKTRQFIAKRYKEIGLKPWQAEYGMPFDYQLGFSEHEGINMVGVLPAEEASDKWRLVIAHYDHLGIKGSRIYPGADDNASGVAALLQLANQLSLDAKAGTSEPINYLFVATDAEEPGLFGGYALTDKLNESGTNPQIAQIELAINMDMIGRPGRPYVIYLVGGKNFQHFDEIKSQLADVSGLCIKTKHPRPVGRSIQKVDWLRASDHYPIHKAGIPWLYFGVAPHRDYHSQTDTAEKIDLNFLAAVSESAYQLLIIDSLKLKKH